jgi:hypothetical protein
VSDVLQRSLLRAGRRTTSRLIGLVLDVIPDALPDLRRMRSTSAATQPGEPFSILSALPGISADASLLRRSDLLIILYPLLTAFTAASTSSGKHGKLRGALGRRVLNTLIEIIHFKGQPATTLAAAFNLLFDFDHLFKPHVIPQGDIQV